MYQTIKKALTLGVLAAAVGCNKPAQEQTSIEEFKATADRPYSQTVLRNADGSIGRDSRDHSEIIRWDFPKEYTESSVDQSVVLSINTARDLDNLISNELKQHAVRLGKVKADEPMPTNFVAQWVSYIAGDDAIIVQTDVTAYRKRFQRALKSEEK